MRHAPVHDQGLARTEFDRAAFQVHEQATVHDVEELVLAVVFMPVELSL